MFKVKDKVRFYDSQASSFIVGEITGIITHEYEDASYKEYRVRWGSLDVSTTHKPEVLIKIEESNDILKDILCHTNTK